MTDVPDPDGVTDKSHGGPGCHPRPGYKAQNIGGDVPGGGHDKDQSGKGSNLDRR